MSARGGSGSGKKKRRACHRWRWGVSPTVPRDTMSRGSTAVMKPGQMTRSMLARIQSKSGAKWRTSSTDLESGTYAIPMALEVTIYVTMVPRTDNSYNFCRSGGSSAETSRCAPGSSWGRRAPLCTGTVLTGQNPHCGSGRNRGACNDRGPPPGERAELPLFGFPAAAPKHRPAVGFCIDDFVVHAAVMERHRIDTISSFDRGFDRLPGVKRIPR